MKPVIIALIGKTASGKDTVAEYLYEEYGIQPVISYTTRPIGEKEQDGLQHWFCSKAEMQSLKECGCIAYTKIGEYEYCTVNYQFKQDRVYSYIIDPAGLTWLKSRFGQEFRIIPIYFDCSEEEILRRAERRGRDSASVIQKRLDSEREQFDQFLNGDEDFYVVDAGESRSKIAKRVSTILKTESIIETYRPLKKHEYVVSVAENGVVRKPLIATCSKREAYATMIAEAADRIKKLGFERSLVNEDLVNEYVHNSAYSSRSDTVVCIGTPSRTFSAGVFQIT